MLRSRRVFIPSCVLVFFVVAPMSLYATSDSSILFWAPAGQLYKKSINLSGDYEGRIYFGNKTGEQYLMQGNVKLHIDESGTNFTLTDSGGAQLKGAINTSVLPEQDSFSTGWIQLADESESERIDIRWYRDEHNTDVLKLVRAKGANRVFRFCSAKLSRAQCKGRVR